MKVDCQSTVQWKVAGYFIKSSALLLAFTGVAKLISSAGAAKVLDVKDPVLGIQFRYLFLLTGVVETVVALLCLTKRSIWIRTGLIAWLASIVFVYRIGLLSIGYTAPCNCLGTMTEAIHLAPQAADIGMKMVLLYIMVGSYIILICLWRCRMKPTSCSNQDRSSYASRF